MARGQFVAAASCRGPTNSNLKLTRFVHNATNNHQLVSLCFLNFKHFLTFFFQTQSVAQREARLPNGLLMGHAYSITGVETVRALE